jgi:hypothetical protein
MNITTSNYEAFYLDYLEGNLSAEASAAFEAFIAEHPELAFTTDDFDQALLSPEKTDSLSEFHKQTLKKEVTISDLNSATIDFFLIAKKERQLTKKENNLLADWLQSNPQFLVDKQFMDRTTLVPSIHDRYLNKATLRKKEIRILPIWWGTIAAAASIALYFSVGVDPSIHPQQKHVFANKSLEIIDSVNIHQQSQKQTTNNKAVVRKPNRKVETNKKPQILPNSIVPIIPPTEVIQQTIAQLPITPLTPIQTVVPTTASVANNSDLAYVPFSEMKNPVAPITEKLTEKLHTPVDFRSARSSEKQKGGFYLKIGKLEISHRGAF